MACFQINTYMLFDLGVLMSSFNWLFKWLVWKVGNGWQVRLDKDPFFGSYLSTCSHPFVAFLNVKGLYLLAQANNTFTFNCSWEQWLSSRDLGLQGAFAFEWGKFVKNLFLMVEKEEFGFGTMNHEKRRLVLHIRLYHFLYICITKLSSLSLFLWLALERGLQWAKYMFVLFLEKSIYHLFINRKVAKKLCQNVLNN